MMNFTQLRRFGPILLSVLLGPACTRHVKPDEMSAVAHRSEAAKERSEAQVDESRYRPDAHAAHGPRRGANDADVPDTQDYNPTAWRLDAASKHRAHAAEHEKAARELEGFEADECKAFGPTVRAACPFLGPVISTENIDGGIRVRLAKGAPVRTIAAHMRCHLAFARARAFETTSCPLMNRGAEVRLTPDGEAIEITSRDAAVTRALRRQTATFDHASR